MDWACEVCAVMRQKPSYEKNGDLTQMTKCVKARKATGSGSRWMEMLKFISVLIVDASDARAFPSEETLVRFEPRLILLLPLPLLLLLLPFLLSILTLLTTRFSLVIDLHTFVFRQLPCADVAVFATRIYCSGLRYIC